jgi:hypothetical protein
VVVVALPPVGPAKPPPLHPVNPGESSCVNKPDLVLPAEGAPLVFGTQLAYGLTLRIESKTAPLDLPVTADPAQGGLVLSHPAPSMPGGDLTGVVRGKWGFDDWEGPRFHLYSPQAGKWAVAAGDQSALVVGREDTLHLEGGSSLCISQIEEQATDGNPLNLTWKSIRPELLEVSVPMKDAAPGPVNLEIYQFGLDKPDRLPLKAYSEAASLDRLTLSVGDTVAALWGTRLDEVGKAEIEGITLTPSALSRINDSDELAMNAGGSTAGLEPGKHYMANVQLQDGRRLKLPVTVEPPRPQVTLLNKGSQEDPTEAPSPVHLGSLDDLPIDERFVFFLRSRVPAKFPRTEKVEVAAVDGSFKTELALTDGSLLLEDSKTAMGIVDPLARFGSSGFGPIQARAVSADGITGDWLTLGTLVRLPGFKELRCPHSAARPCILIGTNLFLAESIGATPDLDNAVDVPADFTGTQLAVPHPANGALYLKLRDDPSTVQTLTLPVTPVSQTTAAKAAPAPAAPQATESAPPQAATPTIAGP